MSIDVRNERLIRLADVPKLKWLPARRGGKRLNCSTCYRWHQQGIRGVKLEAIKAGGSLCTSEAALLRFFHSLTNAGSSPPPPVLRTADFRRAEKLLDQAGI